MQAWGLLLTSIVFEVIGTLLLKLGSESEKAWMFNTGTVVAYVTCFYFMQKAMRYWDLGAMYAIWSGVAIVSLSVIGFVFFKDSITPLKVASVAMVILGIVGLRLA